MIAVDQIERPEKRELRFFFRRYRLHAQAKRAMDLVEESLAVRGSAAGLRCNVAGLYRLVLLATVYGRVLTLFMSGYILFTVNLLYIGGMLNFLINPNFWLKIAVLAVLLVMEPQLMRRPSPSRQAAAPAYYPVPGE